MTDALPRFDADRAIDLDRLREAASRGTGRGVRVAILDTGVEASHPALEGCVKGTYAVVAKGSGLECDPVEGTDPVGHGTACAGIIHAWAPEAEIHSVRVLGKSAVGTGEQFIYGLHWAIDRGEFDVVNLSVGTLQQRFQAALHELADYAYWKRILLVAAAHNRHLVSYPAHFASLISVENGSFSHELSFNYRLDRPVEIEAHGAYVRAPSPGGKYQMWTGTSFACPHITAIAARLRSVIPGLTPFELKTFLRCLRENR
jgi:subtilisin family serine protease